MRSDQGKPISRCCAALVVPSTTAPIQAGVVRQRQFAVAGRIRLGHAQRGQVALDGLAQQPVLGHRKTVARWQRQDG